MCEGFSVWEWRHIDEGLRQVVKPFKNIIGGTSMA